MEKRALLFLILSLMIVMLYPYLLEKFTPVGKREAEKGSRSKTGTVQKSPQEPQGPIPLLAPAQERLLIVETELYRAVLSSRGGIITEWQLKAYQDNGQQPPQAIKLYQPVAQNTPPLSITTGNADLDTQLQQTIFQVRGSDLTLDAERPTGSITLVFDDPAGNRFVAKHLTFQHDSYEVGVGLEVQGIPNLYQLLLGTNFGIVNWGGKGFVGFIGPMTMIGQTLVKDSPNKMADTVRHEGEPLWTALQDKYFIAALIPTEAKAAVISKTHEQAVTVGVEFPSAEQTLSRHTLRLYAGPKEYDRLIAQRVGLEKSIDFGRFIFGSWFVVGAIAKPLFHILRFFHDYTHNYGAAIIMLTVGARVLFIPLMHKSYKAMKAMKAIQPQIAALQKKYKDDREKLNRELMELYKKHGANPLGGCLPMLLQVPVFVALFNVLSTTIELRQAPFILWVTDLSSKDPYYVLPIIMGATMVIQQKMQPTTMDPQQAKLFMFMPVFFTFLFLSFPSGLVLYWLTNNLLTITQQYITLKYLEKAP